MTRAVGACSQNGARSPGLAPWAKMKSAFGAENNQAQRAVPHTLFSEYRETTIIIQQVSAHRHVVGDD
jgi:hypothetical protein